MQLPDLWRRRPKHMLLTDLLRGKLSHDLPFLAAGGSKQSVRHLAVKVEHYHNLTELVKHALASGRRRSDRTGNWPACRPEPGTLTTPGLPSELPFACGT